MPSCRSYEPVVWLERPVPLYERIALYSIAGGYQGGSGWVRMCAGAGTVAWLPMLREEGQIGRASCRERVSDPV